MKTDDRIQRISFALTTKQFVWGTKTETRRLGWERLKPGARLLVVDRIMGFKKGQKALKLGVIDVTEVSRERLDLITQEGCKLEGFPGYTPEQFVSFFCQKMRVTPETIVTRIRFKVFKYLEDGEKVAARLHLLDAGFKP